MKSMAICPMLTAFTDSGSLDFDANERQIERLIAGGIDGILFWGVSGSSQLLVWNRRKSSRSSPLGELMAACER